MSSVATKNLILSQRKSSAEEIEPTHILVNVVDHEDTCTIIKVEIPGVDPSTVDVQCEHNILHVSCPKGSYIYTVDPTVDTSKIKAEIQWGLLTINVPAPLPPVTRSIKINIHDAVKPVSNKPPAKFTEKN